MATRCLTNFHYTKQRGLGGPDSRQAAPGRAGPASELPLTWNRGTRTARDVRPGPSCRRRTKEAPRPGRLLGRARAAARPPGRPWVPSRPGRPGSAGPRPPRAREAAAPARGGPALPTGGRPLRAARCASILAGGGGERRLGPAPSRRPLPGRRVGSGRRPRGRPAGPSPVSRDAWGRPPRPPPPSPTRWRTSPPPAAMTGAGDASPRGCGEGKRCRPSEPAGAPAPAPARGSRLPPPWPPPPPARPSRGRQTLDREGVGDIEAAALPARRRSQPP